MTKLRTLDEAMTEVIEVIRMATGTNAKTRIDIYLWWGGQFDKAPPCVGVRVAELSWSRQTSVGMSGSAVMQCEPGSIGLLAAIERCIIERMVDTAEDQDAEIADADWRLCELLKEDA